MVDLTIVKKPTAPVTASGLGKAGATGVRGGIEGMAGLGDVAHGQRWLVKKIASMLGAGDELQSKIGDFSDYTSPFSLMPTSQQIGEVTDKGVAQLPESVSGPIQDVTRHQPQNRAEEFAQTAGSFAAGAALPVGEVGAAANALTRLGRIAAPTAAVEGSGELADAAGLDPDTKQAVQIVAALFAGGGVGAVENSFRARSAARVVASNPKAVKVVSDKMKADGLDPTDFLTEMQRLGPEAVAPDVGTNLRQETQRIQAAGGEGRGIIEPRLTERNQGKGDRLGVDVEAAVGPEVQRTDVLQALHDRKEAIGQQYPAAKSNQTRAAGLEGIAYDLDAEIATARGGMQSKLQKIRDMLDLPGAKGNLDPSSEGVHAMRVELDRMIEKAKKDGGPAYARLTEYRQRIDAELKDIAPDIKSLDEQYSQASKEGTAFDTGQEIYENPRGAASPTEYQRNWDALSSGEKARALEGVNVETWRQLGIQGNVLGTLKKLLKGEGKTNTQKLATVIGQDKVDALWQAIDREGTFEHTYRKVVEGSKTAESLPEPTSDRFAGDVGDAALTGLVAGPKAGLVQLGVKGLRRLAQKMASGNPDANNPAIAKLLMSDDPAALMRAIQMMRNIQPAIVPEAAVGALQARKKEREPTDIGTITKGNR